MQIAILADLLSGSLHRSAGAFVGTPGWRSFAKVQSSHFCFLFTFQMEELLTSVQISANRERTKHSSAHCCHPRMEGYTFFGNSIMFSSFNNPHWQNERWRTGSDLNKTLRRPCQLCTGLHRFLRPAPAIKVNDQNRIHSNRRNTGPLSSLASATKRTSISK